MDTLDANTRNEIERNCQEMQHRILTELRSQTEAVLNEIQLRPWQPHHLVTTFA